MRIVNHQIGRDPLYKIWNSSEESRIIYFCSDGGNLVFRDAIYPIERGSICFIAPATQHYTVPDDPSVYDRSKIYLSERQTRALISSVGEESEFFRMFTASSIVYAKLPENARIEAEAAFSAAQHRFSEQGREESLVSAFFSLMCLISQYAVDYKKTPDSFIAKAIEYVNSFYSEDITLDELCRVVNMSKSYFCRRFKSVMGTTVMEYVLATRIAAAKSLLHEKRLSIGQISEQCGFSGVSYFCQVFRQKVGVSAGEYRRLASVSPPPCHEN